MSNVADPADEKLGVAGALISIWWFFGTGGEDANAEPAVTCRVAGCHEEPSPVDVFCPNVDHSDLLLFQDRPVGRTRWWVVNLVRAIVVGLVLLAAAAEVPWPVYVLAVAAGVVCIWLPLHAHPAASALGVAWWLVVAAVGGVIAAADVGTGGMRVVWTLAVGVPLALTLCSALMSPSILTKDEPEGVEREAVRGVAGSLALTALATLTWWLTTGPIAGRFVEVPEAIERWLLFAALGSTLGTLLVAAVGGLLVSFKVLDLHVRPRIGEFPKRRQVDWTFQPRPHRDRRPLVTTWGRLRQQLSVLVRQVTDQFRRSVVALARQTTNGLLTFLNASQHGGCRLINWIDRRVRIFARRVLFVARRGALIVGRGAGLALVTITMSVAPLVTYGAGIVGVVASLGLAGEFTDYLVDGALAALFEGVAWSAVGIAATFVVWERLSGVTTAQALRAENRFLVRLAPDLAVFTIVAGWVVGIPGALGHGPIRVGWVTLVGTAILILLVGQEEILDWRTRRRTQHIPTATTSGGPAGSPNAT